MKDNLIIYVSSHNNYKMLEGEVLNIDFEGFEFINIDDGSCASEIEQGKAICKKHNITYLQNKGRGVQIATQTLINFIKEYRPNCKYILCFQHDVKPISKNFFQEISNLISNQKLDEFGGIGFNVLDNGKYTKNSYSRFLNGEKPLGMIGLAHLSVPDPRKRWMSPEHNQEALERNLEKWSKPFIIEFPAWMCVGINVQAWVECVVPTEEYQFHLWFPDVAMQLNRANKPLLVIPHLFCLNQQEVKVKYGIGANSAHGSKKGETFHFGEYSNFNAWRTRWGWEYENVKDTFKKISDKYKDTLIYEYFYHDNRKGPLRNYNL